MSMVKDRIDGATSRQIVIDVGNQIPPEKSVLTYGPAELAMRARIEQWVAEQKAKHPNFQLDVRD